MQSISELYWMSRINGASAVYFSKAMASVWEVSPALSSIFAVDRNVLQLRDTPIVYDANKTLYNIWKWFGNVASYAA